MSQRKESKEINLVQVSWTIHSPHSNEAKVDIKSYQGDNNALNLNHSFE